MVLLEVKNLVVPKDIRQIHSIFKKNGKKLYVVGGAVRDAVLGKTPKDWDLATDAKPDEVIAMAKKAGYSVVEVGKSFGVVIIGGHEIATFRKDIGKGRRPDSVDFTDIEGDVKRRDLTINALFYDIGTDKIVDLVGGIKDLKNKQIRTVGVAQERFDEDPLRKLRVLRFAARLGGKIEKSALLALKTSPGLDGVSAERIRDEFLKSIKSAKSTTWYLKLAHTLKILHLILPNVKYSTSFINNNNYKLQLATLLLDVPNVGKYLKKLKYTDKESFDVDFLIKLNKFNPENIYLLKRLHDNTDLSDSEIIEWGKLVNKDLSKFVKFKLSVNGQDVMDRGFKKQDIGKEVKRLETEKFLSESINEVVNNFKSLYSKLPSPLQKRIFNLKYIGQNPTYHPEGNVLKHTIMVVNRALKDGEHIDYALAAIFHDIGKDETSGIHTKTGKVTHYNHEKVSAELVKKYSSVITKLGGNVDTVYYIVKNHMRVQNFGVMRPEKQKKFAQDPEFGKLVKFSNKFDKGGLGESFLTEIPMADLQKIDKFADKQLDPVDIVLTGQHFFDRLNDPRNEKDISGAELIGFFKRLSRKKKEFVTFLNKYKQVVTTDDRTNINIPFMKKSNRAIAKTVMRKKDFNTPDKRINI